MIDIDKANIELLVKYMPGSLLNLGFSGVEATIDMLDVMDDMGLMRDANGELVILTSCTENELYLIPQRIIR